MPIALAADTVPIAIMELIDNLAMVPAAGAMDAGLREARLWLPLLEGLVIAWPFALAVNRAMIRRVMRSSTSTTTEPRQPTDALHTVAHGGVHAAPRRAAVDNRPVSIHRDETAPAVVQVVQFVHPGFEYQRSEHVGGRHVRSGVMAWKPGNSQHNRKFIVTRGSVFDPETERDYQQVEIVLWGEWEGPSVFWKLDERPGKPMPSIIHAPFRPDHPPIASVQNTDPMVFGETFVYSNCLQHAYVSLRTLVPGSIVLFGRHSRAGHPPAFSLDTCFVVDRVEMLQPIPFDADAYGTSILSDAVLSPLATEGAVDELAVYFGRTRAADSASPFSFFPARLFGARDMLFARPQISPDGVLESVISPDNMQGIKIAAVSVAERDAIWQEVVRQVRSHGCGLGYHAASPPVAARDVAGSAARQRPAPLN